MSESRRVLIFDTTLRDGEQSPGCSMNRMQKVQLATALENLGVDIIEAGFPAASEDDFAAVAEIAKRLKKATVCALSRCHQKDIEASARALAQAERSRIHIFLATSPIHREHKLGMTRQQVVQRAVEGVHLARRYFADVEFSAEDAMRTEPDFLVEVFSAVIEAGATTLNVPDTVGYTTPGEMAECIAHLRAHVPGIDRVVLSAHCHDDLGLAVANSLAAVQAGAGQVECTINGIGERAGNAALEEVVMALNTRKALFGCHTGIDTKRLYPISRQLSTIIGTAVARNKAIVGDNAFAHEAGIHQHGMLANRETYEIMRPEDVGIQASSLVLGKHSGRHALSDRVRELGFDLDEAGMDRLFVDFKRLADRKREVLDADLEALVLGGQPGDAGPWHLVSLQVGCGTGEAMLPNAAVALRHEGGQFVHEAATGEGPLQAVLRAVERASGIRPTFAGIQMRSVTGGEDAQAEAVLQADYQGQRYTGRGLSTDAMVACASGFLELINRIARRHELTPEAPTEQAPAAMTA
jgi:2-isopropylmalate synthase